MIFGPPLTDEYNDLLAKGINLHLIAEHEMPLHMIFIKEIDEEEGNAISKEVAITFDELENWTVEASIEM